MRAQRCEFRRTDSFNQMKLGSRIRLSRLEAQGSPLLVNFLGKMAGSVTWRNSLGAGNGRVRPHIDVRQFGADKKGSFHMLTTVAQWSHNTLILAFAVLTALVVFAI
jgi:hypothetical protein